MKSIKLYFSDLYYEIYPFSKNEQFYKQLKLIKNPTLFKFKDSDYYIIMFIKTKKYKEYFFIDSRGSVKVDNLFFMHKDLEKINHK